jgi:hypothetical protein
VKVVAALDVVVSSVSQTMRERERVEHTFGVWTTNLLTHARSLLSHTMFVFHRQAVADEDAVDATAAAVEAVAVVVVAKKKTCGFP